MPCFPSSVTISFLTSLCSRFNRTPVFLPYERNSSSEGFYTRDTPLSSESPTGSFATGRQAFVVYQAFPFRQWETCSSPERKQRLSKNFKTLDSQISNKSLPKMTSPSNSFLMSLVHISSVMVGSSTGTKCERTSFFTPAFLAIMPNCSVVV